MKTKYSLSITVIVPLMGLFFAALFTNILSESQINVINVTSLTVLFIVLIDVLFMVLKRYNIKFPKTK